MLSEKKYKSFQCEVSVHRVIEHIKWKVKLKYSSWNRTFLLRLRERHVLYFLFDHQMSRLVLCLIMMIRLHLNTCCVHFIFQGSTVYICIHFLNHIRDRLRRRRLLYYLMRRQVRCDQITSMNKWCHQNVSLCISRNSRGKKKRRTKS